jgi:pyruvate ferredoxin oxidoreductase delta subunit
MVIKVFNKMGDENKPGWKKILPGGLTESASALNYKTGSWRSKRPVIDEKKCIDCMFCVNFCPEGCIAVKDGKRGDFNMDYCKGCGLCAAECPVKCIEMKDENDFRD